MATILVYGDSNTWGYSPHTRLRYPPEHRWPCVLAETLGPEHTVIAEGLCGRTTVWDDPLEGGPVKNGARHLPVALESHRPLDVVVILLGTNDLKHRFSLTAADIANGAGVLVDLVRASGCGPDSGPLGPTSTPRVLLVAPPPLGRLSEFRHIFQGGLEKSTHFSCHYRRVATEKSCPLLDAGEFVASSDADGVHLDPEAQVALGRRAAETVLELLTS